MNSPDFSPYPFPAPPAWWMRFFPHYPAAPGLYGEIWESEVQISGNSLLELAQAARLGGCVLALDTGGFPLRSALALGHLQLEQALTALQSLPSTQRPSSLILPQSLALSWGLKNTLDQIPFTTQPDFVPLAAPLEALAASLRLFLAQVLLFSLPLALFGWLVWLEGLSAWFLSALLLGILWRLLPLRPAWMAVGLSLLMSLGLAALSWNSLPQTWPRLIAFSLAPAWFTLLLLGTRK